MKVIYDKKREIENIIFDKENNKVLLDIDISKLEIEHKNDFRIIYKYSNNPNHIPIPVIRFFENVWYTIEMKQKTNSLYVKEDDTFLFQDTHKNYNFLVFINYENKKINVEFINDDGYIIDVEKRKFEDTYEGWGVEFPVEEKDGEQILDYHESTCGRISLFIASKIEFVRQLKEYEDWVVIKADYKHDKYFLVNGNEKRFIGLNRPISIVDYTNNDDSEYFISDLVYLENDKYYSYLIKDNLYIYDKEKRNLKLTQIETEEHLTKFPVEIISEVEQGKRKCRKSKGLKLYW